MEKSNKSNSPFRYPGGKFYARKLILESLPEHSQYCEPFVGGGSVFFGKPKSKKSLLNDKDKNLINTFIQIRDHVEELIESLAGIEATKENHGYFKNEFKPANDLERAKRWFYLNRTSYSGIMMHQNCYFGYGDKYSMQPKNWPRHLRTVSDRIQGVEFTSLDFEEVLNSLDGDYFLFIDPPYFNADQDKFYSCSFNQEDHYRLASLLKANRDKFKFLMTYDNTPEVRDMYDWCISMEDREWNYTISRTDDQKNGKKLEDGYKSSRYKGKEIFIANYDIENACGVEHIKKIA